MLMIVFIFNIVYAIAILNENERIHEHVCILLLITILNIGKIYIPHG